MTTQIFYNETELSGKFQVMTTLKLEGKGIKNYGGSHIIEFNGEIFKENFNYWITPSALANLKANHNLKRACF